MREQLSAKYLKGKNIQWIEVILHLLFWAGTYYIIINSFSVASVTVEVVDGVEVERTNEVSYKFVSFLALLLNALMVYSHAFWGFPRYFLGKKFGKYVLFILVAYSATLILVWVTDVFFFKTYIDPYGGDASIINFRFILVAFFLSVSYVYILFKEWLKDQAQKEAIKKEKLKAELQFLRSQINPHFLYNTINSLFSMAQKKEDADMAEGLSLLADMMRYMLDNDQAELKELKQEVAYISSYVNLQRLRFEEEDFVTISFESEGGLEGWRIHPMILITLIENAFKHGILNEGLSTIDIHIKMDDIFSLTVKNTYNAKEDRQEPGIGLENVRKRLNLLYPESHKLDINKNMNSFQVALHLELEKV